MRLEWIAIRSIIGRKKRSFLLFCTITATVALVFALYTLNHAAGLAIGDSYDKLGPNLVLTAKANSDQALTADDTMNIMTIKDSNSIAAVSPKILVADEHWGLLIGVHFHYETQLRPWWKWQGQLPFNSEQLLIGAELAKLQKLQLAEQIVINEQAFTIVGILDKQGTDEDFAIFMPIISLQNLYKLGAEVTFIEVAALCTTCPLPEIIHQIEHALPYSNVIAVADALTVREQTVERIQQFMTIASIVILILGCLLTGVSVMNNIHQRSTEIGVMRASGLRLLHVVDSLFTELLIFASAAGVVGYSLGLWLARVLTPYFVELPISSEVDIQSLFYTLIITILLTIIASLLPIWRATQIDPVDILRT